MYIVCKQPHLLSFSSWFHPLFNELCAHTALVLISPVKIKDPGVLGSPAGRRELGLESSHPGP